MKLREYLKKNKQINKCCILSLDNEGELVPTVFEDVKDIDSETLDREYMMDEEDEMLEIWVK